MLISWLWERITDVSTLTEVPSNTLLARILEEISSTLRTLTLEVAVPAVVATLWMYSFSTSMNSTLDIGKVTVIITVSESEQDVKLVFSWSPEPDSKDEFIKMTSKWGQECKTVFLQENLFKITWKVPRRTRKASSCSCKIHSNNWDKLLHISKAQAPNIFQNLYNIPFIFTFLGAFCFTAVDCLLKNWRWTQILIPSPDSPSPEKWLHCNWFTGEQKCALDGGNIEKRHCYTRSLLPSNSHPCAWHPFLI